MMAPAPKINEHNKDEFVLGNFRYYIHQLGSSDDQRGGKLGLSRSGAQKYREGLLPRKIIDIVEQRPEAFLALALDGLAFIPHDDYDRWLEVEKLIQTLSRAVDQKCKDVEHILFNPVAVVMMRDGQDDVYIPLDPDYEQGTSTDQD